MCSASRTVVAASVGVMDALKDQGFCEWNSPLGAIHEHARTSLRPYLQAKKLSSPSKSVAISMSKGRGEKLNKSEESLRTVMYLSCWGPNS